VLGLAVLGLAVLGLAATWENKSAARDYPSGA
jgi:hypothetical protein